MSQKYRPFRFSLLLFVLLFLSVTGSGQRPVKIRGNIVDEGGKPLLGAAAFVSGPGTRGDRFFSLTDSNGEFRLTENEDGDYLIVFTEEKEPEGFENIVYPAHITLQKLPSFRGIRSKISEDGWIFLRSINPTVSYRAVTLDLKEQFNFSEKDIGKNLDSLNVSLYSGNLRICNKVKIMPNHISGTKIRIAIPKYDWRIVLSMSDGKRIKHSIVLLKSGIIDRPKNASIIRN